MIEGTLKRQIDAVWNDFWSGGISNPLEVMEQLTYLLFIKALDEQQTLAANKANRTGEPIPAEDDIFPDGQEFRPEGRAAGRPYGDLRWSWFKHLAPAEMLDVVSNYVFGFLQQRASHSTHATHMRDARLTIPTAALLAKAVDGLDAVQMADREGHQGRHLRVHALEDCHGWPERAVPHAAARHRVDGRDDGAPARRRDL